MGDVRGKIERISSEYCRVVDPVGGDPDPDPGLKKKNRSGSGRQEKTGSGSGSDLISP